MNVRPFTRHTDVLYRSPVGDDLVWIDGQSDGMCGSVSVLDERTNLVYREGWSVTSDVSSQNEAIEEAVDAALRHRESLVPPRPEDGTSEPYDYRNDR